MKNYIVVNIALIFLFCVGLAPIYSTPLADSSANQVIVTAKATATAESKHLIVLDAATDSAQAFISNNPLPKGKPSKEWPTWVFGLATAFGLGAWESVIRIKRTRTDTFSPIGILTTILMLIHDHIPSRRKSSGS